MDKKQAEIIIILCSRWFSHLPAKARALKISKCAQNLRDKCIDEDIVAASKAIIWKVQTGHYSLVIKTLNVAEKNYTTEYLKEIPVGVRKYNNRWRCYIIDKNGDKQQEYYDTEEEAQARYSEVYKNKVAGFGCKKRSNSKDQDFPVGVYRNDYTKTNKYGEKKQYFSIKAVVVISGKPVSTQRSYGKLRTEAQAIKECLSWRLQKIDLISKGVI